MVEDPEDPEKAEEEIGQLAKIIVDSIARFSARVSVADTRISVL